MAVSPSISKAVANGIEDLRALQDQLGKLIRSFPEGTNVTLTILRKGAESKVTVKLGKRDMPARRGMNGFDKHWNFGDGDFGMMGNMEDFKDLKDLGNPPKAMIRPRVSRIGTMSRSRNRSNSPRSVSTTSPVATISSSA